MLLEPCSHKEKGVVEYGGTKKLTQKEYEVQFVQIMKNVTDMIPEAMKKKMPLTKNLMKHYQVEKKRCIR